VVDAFDLAMMRRALFHAARGAGRTTPNPMVGSVVVSPGGVIVGQGWHARAGEPHAEVHALNEAGERARGGTLYVTLEPCCHVGRTGPCTDRIIRAGVARVVAAMEDPDPRVRGQGFAALEASGVAVDRGLEEATAARLNQPFVTVRTAGRPLVIVKAATSLDACVAAGAGVRTAITSREANRRTHLLRASVDAIAIGSETARVDDPLLTVRECVRLRPLVRVVFDRRLRTSPAARLLSTLAEGPVIIVTGPEDAVPQGRLHSLRAAGATIVHADSLLDGLRALVRWEVSSVLVEGGPALHRALLEQKLVDRLHLVIAPHVIGPAGIKWIDWAAWPTWSLMPVMVEPRGPDTWIEADVQRHR
jgi:diaminohydroxyphosphoribosylaminopyrimidine deaminase / 5-amino-6-(5-phosphoribosylamino)uracil reductase